MAEKLAIYFCEDTDCDTHQLTYRKKGSCPTCNKQMTRIKYCPECGRAGTTYQNFLCYLCNRHLEDVFYNG